MDVLSSFAGFPSQEKVAMIMLRHGISVKNGRPYCDDIEISDSALGRAADVDRRVVRSTIDHISNDVHLNAIFSKLRSISLFSDVASEIGCSTLEIVPTDATLPGILADVASVIYQAGVTIRQAVVDDPAFNKNAHLIIVLSGDIPSEFIPILRSTRGVAQIIIR